MKNYFLLLIAITFIDTAYSQIVSTFAGSLVGYADGSATDSQFYNPSGLCIDSMGNLFVADEYNQKIRKIASDGTVSTFAGSTIGYADGSGLNAKFSYPSGLCIDNNDNIYVADRFNHKIRKITPEGVVSTIAGSSQGFTNGAATTAKFNYPTSICIDASGNLFVADKSNHKIRKITQQGIVSTFAGSIEGYIDGMSTVARFNDPFGITIDQSGTLFVTDLDNEGIRKITPDGLVNTFAGTSYGYADGNGTNAQFHRPLGICIDSSNNLYVTEISRIRKITPSADVTTIAGTTQNGFQDGNSDVALFNSPTAVIIDSDGNLYIADTANHKIRKVIETLEIQQYHETSSLIIYPNPTMNVLNLELNGFDNGSLFVSDLTGKIISSQSITTSAIIINVSDFEKGLYLVTINDDKKSVTKKFIIK